MMVDRAESLLDYLTPHALHGCLGRDDGRHARFERGWILNARERLSTAVGLTLDRPGWANLISRGLESDDAIAFGQADAPADARGIDTFEVHLRRLRDDPLGPGWCRAWAQADRSQAAFLVHLARDRLDIAAVAAVRRTRSGRAWVRAPPGVGVDLAGTRGAPGLGPDLVLVALRSPSTRNRNSALKVLEAWPTEAWPEGAGTALEEVAGSSPGPRLRRTSDSCGADDEVATAAGGGGRCRTCDLSLVRHTGAEAVLTSEDAGRGRARCAQLPSV
jgi:hypothetical protein